MSTSKSLKSIIIVSLCVAIVSFAGWYFWESSKPTPPQYYTATADKGDLTETVTATGTLKPFLDVMVSSHSWF